MSSNRFPTSQWASWSERFEAIAASLMSLGEKRLLHRAHQRALDSYPVDDNTNVVHRWMEENYAESMLMGLRRLLDKSKGVISFVKLLEEMKKNHSSLHFDRYLELVKGKLGNRTISRQTGRSSKARVFSILELGDEDLARVLYARFTSDGRSLDHKQIGADISELRKDNAEILRFIDTVVAHREDPERKDPRSGPSPEVDWEDLDRLFDGVIKLFNKYYSLVNPGTQLDFEPVLPAGYEQAFVAMSRNKNG